jgi:hypothetical protein
MISLFLNLLFVYPAFAVAGMCIQRRLARRNRTRASTVLQTLTREEDADLAKLVQLLSRCLPRLSSRLTDSGLDLNEEAHFVIEVRELLDAVEAARIARRQAASTAEHILACWRADCGDRQVVIDELCDDSLQRTPANDTERDP